MNIRTSAVATTIAGIAALTGGAVSAAESPELASPEAAKAKLNLSASTPALDECFPHAQAKVTVDLTTERLGKDTFVIEASGLKPRTPFTVFLLEKAGLPFGAAEYIGDFETDQYGSATNTYKLIVEEAFAFNNETGIRKDLNSVGIWFADQKDDNGCLGAASPVTGFDGDGAAGVQMLNSGSYLLP